VTDAHNVSVSAKEFEGNLGMSRALLKLGGGSGEILRDVYL